MVRDGQAMTHHSLIAPRKKFCTNVLMLGPCQVPPTACDQDIASLFTHVIAGAQIGGQGRASNGLDAMDFTIPISHRRHRNGQARKSWNARLWLIPLVLWKLIVDCFGSSCSRCVRIDLVAATQL